MNIEKHRYLGVLKSKAGEVEAISELIHGDWGRWNPLIELMPSTESPESSQKLAICIAGEAIEACEHGRTVFFDFDNLGTISKELVHDVFALSTEKGILAVPVLRVASLPSTISATREYVSATGIGIALRIYLEDLIPERIPQILDLLTQIGVSVGQSYLFLDMREIPEGYVSNLKVVIPALLSLFDNLKEWLSVTIIGTSIPKKLEIPADGRAILPRREWELFAHLHSQLEPRVSRLDFGDYAVTNPQIVSFDPKKMQTSPKILYTNDNSWIAYKGKSTSRHGWGQTQGMCQKVMSEPDFKGELYSRGDEYITNCALAISGPGNSGTWKRVCTNHHITFVGNQVANFLGS